MLLLSTTALVILMIVLFFICFPEAFNSKHGQPITDKTCSGQLPRVRCCLSVDQHDLPVRCGEIFRAFFGHDHVFLQA